MVGVEPKMAGRPTRYTAPSTAPGTEPSPPMTTMETIRIEDRGVEGGGVEALVGEG